MRSLRQYIAFKEKSKYLLKRFKNALVCWNYQNENLKQLFELYDLNFENCPKIIEEILDYLCNIKNIKEHTKIFNCEKYKVFFKKLKIDFYIENTIGGSSKKSGDPSIIVIELKILDKSFEDYELRDNRWLRYTILHELTHNFANFIDTSNGNIGIFDKLLGKYGKEYQTSYNWLYSAKGLRKEIVRCKYFLDDEEMKGYLGTVIETVKNIAEDIEPTFTNLKFDKILKLFEKEFIWEEYVNISTFMDSIDKVDKELLSKYYKATYGDYIDPDEIIDDWKNKWEYFTKELEKAFIEGYSEYEKTMKIKEEISPVFFYNFYQN